MTEAWRTFVLVAPVDHSSQWPGNAVRCGTGPAICVGLSQHNLGYHSVLGWRVNPKVDCKVDRRVYRRGRHAEQARSNRGTSDT